jgi:hypothetical protein
MAEQKIRKQKNKKIFSDYICEKGSISKICEQVLQLNNPKPNNLTKMSKKK